MSAIRKKKSKKHKKKRVREETPEDFESFSYSKSKSRESEKGGGSPQPLQLWVSLGIAAKGRSGLQATGQIGTLRETVEEVSGEGFSDNSEQMESEDTALKLSVNSPLIPVDSASVDKERQHKKAKKKKKKKGHKHDYLTEKPTSCTDHHSAGEKGMDVSFPLSALHRSWGKSKLPPSSKIGGKDLKKMALWEDESKEDHERKRTVDVTVRSGKRLRYQMEENDEEVPKGKKRSHKEQSSDDENVSVGKPEEVPSAVVQEKEEYSPVFLEPENMVEAYQSFLRHVLNELQRRDIGRIFSDPVTDDIAPGYSALISQPMDISTMGQKIALGQYTTVKDFRDDFVLMCKNAMTYNTPDTIYHQAAKKYLALGLKIIIKELESRPDIHRRYGVIPEMEPPPSTEFPVKPTNVKINTKGPFVCRYSLKTLKKLYAKKVKSQAVVEPLSVTVDPDFEQEVSEVVVDNSQTALHVGVCDDVDCVRECVLEGDNQDAMEEMVRQMILELEEVRSPQEERASHVSFCFLNKDAHGYTKMNILNPDSGGDPVEVDMSVLDQRVADGRAAKAKLENEKQLLKEKPITFLMYGPYGSFAPSMSSTFATLSKVDTELLYSTYGDDLGVSYSHSLQQFSQGTGAYIQDVAESLLNGLTSGRHKTFKSKLQKEGEEVVAEKKNVGGPGSEGERKSSLKDQSEGNQSGPPSTPSILPSVAGEQRSTHSSVGVSQSQSLQQTLNETASMIMVLQQKQNQRLGLGAQTGAHPPPPSSEEKEIAYSILNKLKNLSSLVRPEDLVSRETLRRAMGIALRSVEQSSSRPKEEVRPSHGPKEEVHPSHGPKDEVHPSHGPKEEIHPSHGPKEEVHPSHGPKDEVHPLNQRSDECTEKINTTATSSQLNQSLSEIKGCAFVTGGSNTTIRTDTGSTLEISQDSSVS